MALHRILVVDDSPAIRETLGILLGGQYEVHAATVEEFVAHGLQGPAPHLIVAGHAEPVYRSAQIRAPGVPVLWLDRAPGGAPLPQLVPGSALPWPFSPRLLRARVAALLAAPAGTPGGGSLARLQPPFVPVEAARILRDAVAVPLSVHVCGEPGVGKQSIARALHDARGAGIFTSVSAAAFDAAAVTALPAGTLCIGRIEQLPASAQQALLALLDGSGSARGRDGAPLRVVTTATVDLAALVDAGTFLPGLFYRLTVLGVHVPPLRERPADIAPLANVLAAEMAAAFARPPVLFTERAIQRLGHYLWFGNLAELQAVLARSIALGRDAVLDADDLRFDPQPPRASARQVQTAAAHDGRDGLGSQSLDLIINELAHEFKNPLVTIKTFAHHLRRAHANGDDEAQVARLTGEAVEQIDQTLENLLEFTRLDTPAPRRVALSLLLDPVLDDCARALAARGLRLEHSALPAIEVLGDPQQLAYALTNLVRSVTRDLAPDTSVRLDFTPPATLTLTLPDGSERLGNHLATLLETPANGTLAVPLGVAIAHAVLERNGAQVASSDETPSIISIRFRLADAEEPLVGANGSHARTGR